jgi:hypothetical protein
VLGGELRAATADGSAPPHALATRGGRERATISAPRQSTSAPPPLQPPSPRGLGQDLAEGGGECAHLPSQRPQLRAIPRDLHARQFTRGSLPTALGRCVGVAAAAGDWATPQARGWAKDRRRARGPHQLLLRVRPRQPCHRRSLGQRCYFWQK